MQTGIFYSGFRVSHPLRLDRGSRLYLRKSAKSADEPNTDTLTLNPRLFSAGLSGSLRLKWPVQTSSASDLPATNCLLSFLVAALLRRRSAIKIARPASDLRTSPCTAAATKENRQPKTTIT